MTDLVSLCLYKKESKKKLFLYLPYLAFSDMLPEPHLFFYLTLADLHLFQQYFTIISVMALW